LTFPYYETFPTHLSECSLVLFVTGGVSFEFSKPEFLIVGRRRTVLAATMSMPEAAVHKEGNTSANKNDIRIAGKILAVKSKPVTHAMEQGTHAPFGLRVFATN